MEKRDLQEKSDQLEPSDVKAAPEWPTHFPVGCPSDINSLPTDGEIFRLVTSNPPTMDDAKSVLELGQYRGKPECQRAGLSCFLTLTDVVHKQMSVPRLQDHLIGKAVLDQHHGRIAQTGNDLTHHTLWLKAEHLVRFPQLFEVCS